MVIEMDHSGHLHSVRTPLVTTRHRLQYWLVIRRTIGGMEVFTLGLANGKEALSVFSSEEEAIMFLRFRRINAGDDNVDGWKVRQSSAGELVSLLYGPCRSTHKVALDPLPEMASGLWEYKKHRSPRRFTE